ncbi:hypothetical protein CSAL01_11933 [Colletotrichum salicis]|uniref:Uncharacterized protein n=1 Tax=Colletotrichum salicis TaxID=1209931 RepID=A0A135UM26_9PEZI|nr:hypothetical protein CSAL01_11933 [Colletotrichum salicis]
MSSQGRPLFRFERYVRAAPVRYDPFLPAVKSTTVSASDRHRHVRGLDFSLSFSDTYLTLVSAPAEGKRDVSSLSRKRRGMGRSGGVNDFLLKLLEAEFDLTWSRDLNNLLQATHDLQQTRLILTSEKLFGA